MQLVADTADPGGILHSVCTMAFPFEGLAFAIVYDVVVSALASYELDVVGIFYSLYLNITHCI